MPDLPAIDPDLEQVLADVANDSRSKLFVTDPRKLIRGLQDGSIQVSESRTGLRPAERHLLRVYRWELAYLLKAAFLDLQQSTPGAFVYLHDRPGSADHESRKRAFLSMVHRSHLDGDMRKGVDLLSPGASATPGTLVACALVLSNSPDGKVHLANHYASVGQLLSAKTTIETVLSKPQPPKVLDSAWQTHGVVLGDLASPTEALEAYERAFSVAIDAGLSIEEHVLSAMNILDLSMRVSRASTVSRIADWFEENVSPESPVIGINTAAMNACSYPDAIPERDEALVVALKPTSRRIVHALD